MHIWFSSPFLTQNLKPVDKSSTGFFCYVHVTLGKLLGNLRMGTGCLENRHGIGELELSAPAPHLLGGEGSVITGAQSPASDLISCAWVMKPP